MRFVLFFLVLFLLNACEATQQEKQEPSLELRLVPAKYSDLPGWENDSFEGFRNAFAVKSCERILKKPADAKFGAIPEAGTYGQWQEPCAELQGLSSTHPQTYRGFFERHFEPYQVFAGAEPMGLFTGYYEASLQGSRIKTAKYNIPLHKRSSDLVMVQLGDFRDELKGQRIAGRVVGGNLKPYETREQIVAGQWPHNDEVLVWVDDAVDAFFVQIQGSGIVTFEDGSEMRIGYAGQNGHIYTAIGRELIARGAMTKEEVSMQSIRAWLENNPDQADEIMNVNKSYVFFEEITREGPIGGEGVALTALRSLAVDHSLLPYGLPLWVDIAAPAPGEDALQRMMIAQDTGGAIRGPVRGDVFWGHGERAEAMAGVMKSQGRYWVLLPKTAVSR